MSLAYWLLNQNKASMTSLDTIGGIQKAVSLNKHGYFIDPEGTPVSFLSHHCLSPLDILTVIFHHSNLSCVYLLSGPTHRISCVLCGLVGQRTCGLPHCQGRSQLWLRKGWHHRLRLQAEQEWTLGRLLLQPQRCVCILYVITVCNPVRVVYALWVYWQRQLGTFKKN